MALPVILASATYSYNGLRLYQAQSAEAERTRSFLYPWTNLLVDVHIAESGQRGFLLTGRKEYLRNYDLAIPRIQLTLAGLQSASSLDPEQNERTKAAFSLARKKLAELNQTLELYEAGQRAAALDLVNADSGDRYMTELTALMTKIRERERAILSAANQQAKSQARNTLLVNTATDLILLVFLSIAGVVIDRENRRRVKDEEFIGLLNQRLSHELKERSDILSSIQDGFCAFDAEFRATYINPAAEHLFHARAADLTGKAFDEILDTASFPQLRHDLETVIGTKKPRSSEHHLPRYEKWLRMRFYPATEGGFTLYFSDITEEKRAEAERARLLLDVQEMRVLLDTFFENAPIGFGVWDQEMRSVRVNRALSGMNGGDTSPAYPQPVARLLPNANDDLHAIFLKVLRSGESITAREITEAAKQTSDKRRTWMVSCYPIRTNNAIVGAGGIIEEITERKAIEESLRESAKLESVGVLAGGIAHDFNNLLTGILGNASLALDFLPPDSPANGILGNVIAASERAAHLTRQMLAYAGKGQFVLQMVDLSEIVREISSLIKTSVARNVRLHLDLQYPLPCVYADMVQLQQLVMNLVINGAEAIPEGETGTVTINTAVRELDDQAIRREFPASGIESGRYVCLEVRDTGSGMNEATVARIFDPFFTTKFTGRGLGLAAVLGIVRGHKGALNVKSAPGKGTSFEVLFPARGEALARVEPVRSDAHLEGSANILVVDDEEIVRRTTKAMLENFGHSVILAENGREGVELLRVLGDRIQLVLLDLTMPVMNGEEALEHIRKIRPDLPVILSSGFNEVESVARFDGKGLAGFLQKPYSAHKLAETVLQSIHARQEA